MYIENLEELKTYIRETQLVCAYKLIILYLSIQLKNKKGEIDKKLLIDLFIEFYQIREDQGLKIDAKNCNPLQDENRNKVEILLKRNPIRILKEKGILKDFNQLETKILELLQNHETTIKKIIIERLGRYFTNRIDDSIEKFQKVIEIWNSKIIKCKRETLKQKFENLNISPAFFTFLIDKWNGIDTNRSISTSAVENLKNFCNKFQIPIKLVNETEKYYNFINDRFVRDRTIFHYHQPRQFGCYYGVEDRRLCDRQDCDQISEDKSEFHRCKRKKGNIYVQNNQNMPIRLAKNYIPVIREEVLKNHMLDINLFVQYLYNSNSSEVIQNFIKEFNLKKEELDSFFNIKDSEDILINNFIFKLNSKLNIIPQYYVLEILNFSKIRGYNGICIDFSNINDFADVNYDKEFCFKDIYNKNEENLKKDLDELSKLGLIEKCDGLDQCYKFTSRGLKIFNTLKKNKKFQERLFDYVIKLNSNSNQIEFKNIEDLKGKVNWEEINYIVLSLDKNLKIPRKYIQNIDDLIHNLKIYNELSESDKENLITPSSKYFIRWGNIEAPVKFACIKNINYDYYVMLRKINQLENKIYNTDTKISWFNGSLTKDHIKRYFQENFKEIIEKNENKVIFDFIIGDKKYIGTKKNKNLLKCEKLSEKLEIKSLIFENIDNLIQNISIALKNKKHIILIGPPGTGKSSLAELICKFYMGEKYIMTIATSDWSTFETIGGYRPNKDGVLEFSPGVFLECFKDENGNDDNKWLIIDEINRADIDKAFGSLFSPLTGLNVCLSFKSKKGENIKIFGTPNNNLDEKENFYIIPEDWRIICTMNTFDKSSLYEMSYAFMRRFAFILVDVPHEINEDLIKKYLECWNTEIDDKLCSKVADIWKTINKYRKIGPAIIKDLYAFIKQTNDYVNGIVMYVFPQFEGLMIEKIKGFINDITQLSFIESKSDLIYYTSTFFNLEENELENNED